MMPFNPLVEIIRVEKNQHFGTFGVLLIQGAAFCVTLELPWRMNEQNISCIPASQYVAIRVPSEKFREVFLLQDVPGRGGIEIHPGNDIKDTEGCIIVASEFGKLRFDARAVLNSMETFNRFMRALDGYDRIIVRIKDLIS